MLTVTQAAERAAVSESLIYQWCREGTLPHMRLGGKGRRGTIRIEETDLDAVLASFKVQAKPGAVRSGEQPHLKHIRL